MPNHFLPQFKSKTRTLLDCIPDNSKVLIEHYNQFLETEGKAEAEIAAALKNLFNSISDHLQKQGNEEAFDKLVQLFDFIATSDEALRQDVNHIKELLKQDAVKKKEGHDKFLALLAHNDFIQFCSKLLSRKSKTLEEKFSGVSDKLKREFALINETLVNQSIYSGWGSLGVQFVNLLHAAVHMLAVKAGYDIPDSAEDNKPHHGEANQPDFIPNPLGPDKPRIPLWRK